MSNYITKDEVGRLLGVTERQVERHAKKGRLTVKQERGEDGVRRNYYLEDEVIKLREYLLQVEHQPAVTTLLPPSRLPQTHQTDIVSDRMNPIQVTIKQGSSLSDKLVLTIEEAEEYSGVSGHAIRQAIKRGELACFTGLGRGYRVKRKEVESWVEGYEE